MDFLRAFTSQAAQVRKSFEKRHLENTKVDFCGFGRIFGGFLWILVDFGGFWWILVDSGGFWWILMDSGGF